MGLHERIRNHAQEAREHARRATDPLIKSRLHDIANLLDRAADELERLSDPDHRG
jgi:hypothetical protein